LIPEETAEFSPKETEQAIAKAKRENGHGGIALGLLTIPTRQTFKGEHILGVG
jgi:hypothetical protein